MISDITVANKLDVIGTDTIIIPGCEPQSALTSDTLARFIQCGGKATVKLSDALAAIPGSTVEFQVNNGQSNGARRKWFVLPPLSMGCSCDWQDDHYRTLKELIPTEDEEDSEFSSCEVIDQGFCPPPNFNQTPPPPVNPYKPEGDTLGGTISLLNDPNIFQNPDLIDPIIEG